jgi:hypothetical protein
MAITFSTTRLMANDLNYYIGEYPNATLLVPQWVTYSPVAYYCQGKEIWTYMWDFQIGEVFGRDISNRKAPVNEALIPVYLSSFLGRLDEEQMLTFLVYSRYNVTGMFWGSNTDTAYGRTGLDTFEVVSAGQAEYVNGIYWQRSTITMCPYFIAHGWRTGDGNVTVNYNGTRYWCPTTDLQYDGQLGPGWAEKFFVEEIP